MKNLQKVLAGCSAFIMCFTSMLGGISASAEGSLSYNDGNISVSVSGSNSKVVINGVEYSEETSTVDSEEETSTVDSEEETSTVDSEEETSTVDLEEESETLGELDTITTDEITNETSTEEYLGEWDQSILFDDTNTLIARDLVADNTGTDTTTDTYAPLSVYTKGSGNYAITNYKLGDINNDGDISVIDYTLLQRQILQGNITSTLSGDVNKDGKVNILDVLALKRKVVAGVTMSSTKICLDSGHFTSKTNKTTIAGYNYTEAAGMWELQGYLAEELMSYGFDVVLTRDSVDMDKTVRARGESSEGCDLFLCLHSNACDTTNEDYTGSLAVTNYYAKIQTNKKALSDTSNAVGTALVKAVAQTTGFTGKVSAPQGEKTILQSSGTGWAVYNSKTTDEVAPYLNYEWYGVLTSSRGKNVPGILLEHTYHTSTQGTAFLSNSENLKKLAKAEAKALAEYYGWY